MNKPVYCTPKRQFHKEERSSTHSIPPWHASASVPFVETVAQISEMSGESDATRKKRLSRERMGGRPVRGRKVVDQKGQSEQSLKGTEASETRRSGRGSGLISEMPTISGAKEDNVGKN